MLRPRFKLCHFYRLSEQFSTSVSSKSSFPFCGRRTHHRKFSQIRHLSTFAHKHEIPPEPVQKVDYVVANSIDEKLSKIDETAKRIGRVMKKDVISVFESIKQLGKASSIQILYLIRCCGSLMHDEIPLRKNELLNEIWNKLMELQIPVDASHYNSLLKAYLENDFVFDPTSFLSSMEQNGIEPNRVTYQRLIDSYCKEGNLIGASTVLEYMKEKGMPVNESVFTSLIRGHLKSGDFDGARNMLEVMRKSQLTPGAAAYCALANGYAEKGDIQNVLSLFGEAEQSGVFLSNKDYLSVFDKLAVSGHSQYIDEIFNFIVYPRSSRQDFINTVLDLVNKGLEDVAYKVVKKATEVMEFHTGTVLFIGQQILLNRPIEKIIAFCEDIQSSGSNDYIFSSAIKSALESENIECAMALMQKSQKLGYSIKSHYFWPIFAFHARNNDIKGIWNTLKKMTDFGIPADFDTYIDYVLPHVDCKDPERVITSIKEAAQSDSFATEPLFFYYCDLEQLELALYVCENYGVHFESKRVLKSFIALAKGSNPNYPLLLQVLKSACEHNKKTLAKSFTDLCGELFLHLCLGGHLSTKLLTSAHNMGITLSDVYAKEICNNLGHPQTEEVQIIRSMQYGAPLPQFQSSSQHPGDMDLQTLEKHVAELKMSGRSPRNALQVLLIHYCKNKDLEKVVAIKNELDSIGFFYTPALYALLIDSFVSFNDMAEAERLKNQLAVEYPDATLDALKVVHYATLLVKCNRFEEVFSFLRTEFKDTIFGQKDMLLRSVKKLLGSAADSGNVELTKDLFDFFTSTLCVTEPRYLLECLVKVHISRNDLESAITEYKKCVKDYKFAPCRNVLFKKFITTNDFEQLQTVVDITTACNGRISTMHELAFSFIECDLVQQAYKVFQTLAGQTEMSYLEELLSRFVKDKKITECEKLLMATRNLVHVDRDKLFFGLLSLYVQNNLYEKALPLWDAMQEENIQPSSNTLRLLACLLEKNDQPVPFVVPASGNSSFSEESRDNSITRHGHSSSSELSKCLELKDIDGVLDQLNEMKKGNIRLISTDTMSSIVDHLLQQGRIKDISNNVQVMSYILEKVRVIFKPIMEKYSNAGNIDVLKQIREFLPDFSLKSVAFNHYFNHVHLISGQYEELMHCLETQIYGREKLFSISGFLGILENAPHLEERAVELVKMYLEKEKFDLPVRALWIHYFNNEKFDKAEKVFKSHPELFTSLDIITGQVLKHVRKSENVGSCRKFIEFLNHYEAKPVFKNRTHSCLLDILVSKSMIEEASVLIKEVQESEMSGCRFDVRTLLDLKVKMEEQGIPVTFEVPAMDNGSDTSSSDSD